MITPQVKFIEETFAQVADPQFRDKLQRVYFADVTKPSAGLDLRYIGHSPITLAPGEQHLIHTGLAIYLEDPSYVGKVYPRSGLGGKAGLVLGNLTGIIDADYQGELMLMLWNRQQPSQKVDGVDPKTITVQPGDRVAQYIVVKREPIAPQLVTDFTTQTERGDGGFGSTGTQ